MSNVTDLKCTLENFEELIAAIIAENCSEMFKYGRKLLRKNYYDPEDTEANNEPIKKGNNLIYDTSKSTVENRYNEAKNWFTDPKSEFNTYWKDMMSVCKREESILNGTQIASAIDQMIQDVENYPEDTRSFRQEK